MFFYYNDIDINRRDEGKNAWRSASEIAIAAHEREKRRFRDENISLVKPWLRAEGDRLTGWAAILKAPLRLLMILFG